ncbi:MAG: diguanylate cyclase [Solobacterium sp.]|nr:diguanylate cyclase [Solobacterium sp.]
MLKEVFKHLKNTQCFVKYREKVSEYNADALGIFLTLGLIVSICAVVLQFVLLRTTNFWVLIGLAIYFAICLYYYHKHIETKVDRSTIFLYLAQIPVLIVGIIMGTYMVPATKAFSIMLMLVSFPIFILDRPRNILIYLLAIILLFGFFDAKVKTGELLLHDLLHLIMTALFSIGSEVFVLSTRIENVEKSQMFQTDSEHDPLTGIYNRRGGEDKIRECIEDEIGGTFILLDIDDFKHVNDTYGHAMGDEVLSSVSMQLSSAFRSSDVVMRMGGDEFIVYAPGLVNYFFIDGKLQQINARMREITCSSGKDNITVSMGAVINDGSYPSYEAIFNEADALLYEMKKNGKNGFRLQDRPYSEILSREANKEAAKARAERDAASEAEEAKYKK